MTETTDTGSSAEASSTAATDIDTAVDTTQVESETKDITTDAPAADAETSAAESETQSDAPVGATADDPTASNAGAELVSGETYASAEQVIDTTTATEPFIKPFVSQIVHYWNEAPIDANDQPEAAIITFVHDDFTVNLTVFDSNGAPRPQRNVTLENGQEVIGYPRAEWMQHQLDHTN